MKETTLVHRHINDMLALDRHILEAVEKQRSNDEVRKWTDVNENLLRIDRVIKGHAADLEKLTSSSLESTLKQGVSRVLGTAAGLYDRIRPLEMSRILRDHYTVLNLVVVSLEMLHTTCLAFRIDDVASIALEQLSDVLTLLDDIRSALPKVVVDELSRIDGLVVEPLAIEDAKRNVRSVVSVSAD